MSKKESGFIEFLYLFSSLFFVFLLLTVLFYSFIYWNNNYPNLAPLEVRMFYIAIGIAIVTSIGQWIEGRIKAIIESWNVLFKVKGGNHGREKARRTRKKRRTKG